MADVNYNPATDPDSPAYECEAYLRQMRDLEIVNDCYEGTATIAGKQGPSSYGAGGYGDSTIYYLRRFGAESDDDFAMRLATSKFWNAYRRTVHGLVGLIFRKNPVLDNDVPAAIRQDLEDIDLQGMHLDVFAKERCTRGMIDGASYIYIDKPQPVSSSGNAAGVPTYADQKQAVQRPYWIPVDKKQIPNWRVQTGFGVNRLMHVSIRECVKEPSGAFGEMEVTQYRVLRPGSWELWRQPKEGAKYEIINAGTTPLDYIPLVPFYALQIGYFESTPPLLDVAHENLRHYGLQSGLDRILDLCNIPTPVRIGASDVSQPLVVGASVIDIPVGGDVKFLEPTGAAIEKTQQEIDRAKANIASLGLLLLSSQPKVTKTATETTVEYTAETSELSAIARNLQDALERALMIHAEYMGQPSGGSVKINRDFVRLGLDPQAWQRIQDDVVNGRFTLETYWKILENAEQLPEDFNAEEERAALDMEKEKRAALVPAMLSNFDRGLSAGPS